MRARSIGLAALVLLATSIALSAPALGAELGQCVKVAKVEKRFHGVYLDKNCLDSASEAQVAEGKKNKYDWAPRTAATTTRLLKPTELESLTPGGTELECLRSGVDIGWENATEGSPQASLTCRFRHIAGRGFEEFEKLLEQTPTLHTVLEGPAGHAWERFEAGTPGTPIVEWEYNTGQLARLTGSFDGVLEPPNKMSSSFSVSVGVGICIAFKECKAGEAPQSVTLELSHDDGLTWEAEPIILRWETKFKTAVGVKDEVKS